MSNQNDYQPGQYDPNRNQFDSQQGYQPNYGQGYQSNSQQNYQPNSQQNYRQSYQQGFQPYPNGAPNPFVPGTNQPRKKSHAVAAFFGGCGVGAVVIGLLLLIIIFPVLDSNKTTPTKVLSNSNGGFSEEEQQELIDKANKIVASIDQDYLDEVDHEKLLEGALHGIVNGVGDKYSAYFSAEELSDFYTSASGNYVGIGVTVQQNDLVNGGGALVVEVNPNGGAYEAGIQPGDILMGADGTDFSTMLLNEMVSYMRGDVGTKVEITYYHAGEKKEVTIERRELSNIEVRYEMLEDHVGYLALTGFDEVATDQFMEALTDLTDQGMETLILDLRDNPGGLVNVATDIADNYLDEGTVTYMIDKYGNREDYSSTTDGKEVKVKMYILMNQNSASAAELLAGCLRDRYGAILVGTQSFGKGIVQTTRSYSDGSGIKLTTAKFYTPDGINFHGVGLSPDIEVELPEDTTLSSIRDDQLMPVLEKDTQLQAVLKAIREGK